MIEQSDSDSEPSEHPPPVLVPEGGKEGAPPNTPFVELDDAPVAPDSASAADFYNPDEPYPEHLCQIKQIWRCQSGQLYRADKVICTCGPKQIPIPSTILFNKKLKSK